MSATLTTPQPEMWYPPKDPYDVLSYGMDFTSQMTTDNDTLASLESVTATVAYTPAGTMAQSLTVSATALTGNLATCILSGGTLGTIYRVSFRVSTSKGFTYERSARVLIKLR